MVIVACGDRADWLCTQCAKCGHCCRCEGSPHLVHSNSGEGAHILTRVMRQKREELRNAQASGSEAASA